MTRSNEFDSEARRNVAMPLDDATSQSFVTTDPFLQRARRWKDIQSLISDWNASPTLLRAQGLVPPTNLAYRRAFHASNAYFVARQPAPDRVVPTGDGGVAYEWYAGEHDLEFGADGQILWRLFSGSATIETRSLAEHVS